MANNILNNKANNYNITTTFLLFVFFVFGLLPTILGLVNNNIDLVYRSLNFAIASYALLIAIRSGFFLSDRDLKKGWSHWLERNKKKVDMIDAIASIMSLVVFLFLAWHGFFK